MFVSLESWNFTSPVILLLFCVDLKGMLILMILVEVNGKVFLLEQRLQLLVIKSVLLTETVLVARLFCFVSWLLCFVQLLDIVFCLAGGITTLVDMPLNSCPSTVSPETLKLKVKWSTLVFQLVSSTVYSFLVCLNLSNVCVFTDWSCEKQDTCWCW